MLVRHHALARERYSAWGPGVVYGVVYLIYDSQALVPTHTHQAVRRSAKSRVYVPRKPPIFQSETESEVCEVVDCANASTSRPSGRAGQGTTKYRVMALQRVSAECCVRRMLK